VLDAVTGKPLNKVAISLSQGFPPHGEACGTDNHYSAITDPNGRFEFPDLAPGCYSVKAERALYAPLIAGSHDPNEAGSSVVIRLGEHLKGAVLELEPQGLIAGRVLNEDGSPSFRASLQLWRVRFYACQN
jgi:hypothetical protein